MFGLIILLIIAYFIYKESYSGGLFGGHHTAHTRNPLDILDERYARGEINREEYFERKAGLSGRKQTVSLEKANQE
ncbi:SHOCT domain-containing protein [Desulfosporosinus sp. SYSU MS00001]|uniref:SHOCT domain-containing protein n=1 Tax=Desulfosporosinus sp. SYSU MS00001 TaxID=3416284 RepID=UPI003CE742A0